MTWRQQTLRVCYKCSMAQSKVFAYVGLVLSIAMGVLQVVQEANAQHVAIASTGFVATLLAALAKSIKGGAA
jgi:hypothetical protein